MKENSGFLYIEALFVCGIILILFAATAFFGSKIFVNIAAEYEAVKLVGDLRYAQEINRNSFYPRDGVFDSIKPHQNSYFVVKFYGNKYKIEPIAKDTHKEIVHQAITNVVYVPTSSLYRGVHFLISGDVRQIGNITVESKFAGAKARRYVIIDKSGRVRMDRNPP
ncbi:MAG: hypothetical protein IKN12_13245 [Selenomonadaceae bacterium]|nr:hypothetical protein [Selenomonadaceae bacterium]